MRRFGRSVLVIALFVPVAGTGLIWPQTPGYADVALARVSSDPFVNTDGQHRSMVGPDIALGGNLSIFTVFQAGRSVNGGSAGVGFAGTHDKGAHWSTGFLDGITVHKGGGGYTGVSDVALAFRINYNRWLFAALATGGPGGSSALLISVTWSDGLNWRGPYTVATGQVANPWVHCDNWSPSFSQRCYAGYSLGSAGNALRVHTSIDGGVTWGPARATADGATGVATRPVILRSGTVILPYLASNGQLRATRSVDGGATWTSSTPVATVQRHTVAGGLRTSTLPSLQLDNNGTAFLAWSDCRFRAGCAANDIVLSTTRDGTTWSTPARIAGPMSLSWLPQTTAGRMFADALTTVVTYNGNAMVLLPVASAPSGGQYNQAMYAPIGGIPLTGGTQR